MTYVNPEKCHFCDKQSYTVERRRLNTQYVDDASNWLTSCAACYADQEEYYAERWAEYYNGCM